MRLVVGLDVSLELTAVCVINRDGEVVWQGKVESEPRPLAERLRPWSAEIDIVGLEACPQANPLQRALVAAGFHAVCIETRHAQRFLSSRPVKTDRNDAYRIAQMDASKNPLLRCAGGPDRHLRQRSGFADEVV